MSVIPYSEVSHNYTHQISLQRKFSYRVFLAEPKLSIVTGFIAVAVLATAFIALTILIVSGSR